MNYLLDTNILSELIRPEPNQGVIQWFLQYPEQSCFISVMTLSELHYGIERLPEGKRKLQMQQWLKHTLTARFSGRILVIDDQISLQCGSFRAIRQNFGQPLAVADGLIAASAFIHGFTVVTRNVKDFIGLDISLVNLFTE